MSPCTTSPQSHPVSPRRRPPDTGLVTLLPFLPPSAECIYIYSIALAFAISTYTCFRPEVGDHLAVLRAVGYYHHGIYVDDDEVVEVTDKGVGKISYADFKNGCPLYRIEYRTKASITYFEQFRGVKVLCRRYLHDETRRRALEVLKYGLQWKYNLTTNNCEHFATWIVMGFKYSMQTNRWTVKYSDRVYERSLIQTDDFWDYPPM